ncbi:MAG: hypothetical protein ABSE87_12480 [Terracidiphilus sp.]
MSCIRGAFHSRQTRRAILLLLAGILFAGCRSPIVPQKPSIEITSAPVASLGGPTEMDNIEGRVTNSRPNQQVVLYAHSGVWWIQPLANQPYTRIQSGSTWKNATHLGTEYAALLVDPGYRPASRLADLPAVGSGIAAMTIVPGRSGVQGAAGLIRFSGYEWTVRSGASDRQGEPNQYDSSNAWTDENGYLHLRMGLRNGRWTCAEVSLNQSLGYGTYSFVIEDSARLRPSAVLGLFTWDDARSVDYGGEFDIQLSRWADPNSRNAQYLIQPFFVGQDLFRFNVPGGVLTHRFSWRPGSLTFTTIRGDSKQQGETIAEHVFASSVPTPASERVHIDLYDFHHSQNSSTEPAEAVIQHFTFVPSTDGR